MIFDVFIVVDWEFVWVEMINFLYGKVSSCRGFEKLGGSYCSMFVFQMNLLSVSVRILFY